jgi:hypothetical protein
METRLKKENKVSKVSKVDKAVKSKNIEYTKTYIKKGGSSEVIGEGPYILHIPIFEENEKLLDSAIGLEFNEDFSPLSGSEVDYNPELWNKDSDIRNAHNCYSYALGKIVKGLDSKAQPGYASGYRHIEDSDYNCKTFRERLRKDSPGSYLEKFDNACLPGFYKVFLALDPTNDYHWYKQDTDKYWSHKPGSTNVINIDASGNRIKNPLIANRKYDSLNYFKPCFFACIYSDLTRSLADIYHIK